MTDTPSTPKKSNTGKILLGCGLLALLILVGGGATAYFVFKDSFMMDPVRVEALAGDINGADAPAGFNGVLGIDVVGVKTAVLVSDGGYLLVLGSCPAAQSAQLSQQMEDSLDQQSADRGGKKETIGKETLAGPGGDVEFEKVRITGNEAAHLRYSGALPERDGRISMIIYMGPEEGFDKATLKAYLKSIPAPAGAGK